MGKIFLSREHFGEFCLFFREFHENFSRNTAHDFDVLVRSFWDSERARQGAAAANGKRRGREGNIMRGSLARSLAPNVWLAGFSVRSAPLNNSRTLQREGTMRCIDSGREGARGVRRRRRRHPIGRSIEQRWTVVGADGRTLLKCEISDRAERTRRPGERTMTDRLAPEKGALIFLPPMDLIETS